MNGVDEEMIRFDFFSIHKPPWNGQETTLSDRRAVNPFGAMKWDGNLYSNSSFFTSSMECRRHSKKSPIGILLRPLRPSILVSSRD